MDERILLDVLTGRSHSEPWSIDADPTEPFAVTDIESSIHGSASGRTQRRPESSCVSLLGAVSIRCSSPPYENSYLIRVYFVMSCLCIIFASFSRTMIC